MNRKPLIELSKEVFLNHAPEEMQLEIGDLAIMRSEGTVWAPCVFMGYSEDPDDDRNRFRSGEGWHSMCASLLGNEKAVGYQDDVLYLMDSDWMREKGLLEDNQ